MLGFNYVFTRFFVSVVITFFRKNKSFPLRHESITCDHIDQLGCLKEERGSLGASRLASLHEIQAPWEVSLQTELSPQESSRLVEPLDVPSNLPWWVFPTRGRKSQAHNVQHAVVESVVEFGPAARIGVVVPALIATVGV